MESRFRLTQLLAQVLQAMAPTDPHCYSYYLASKSRSIDDDGIFEMAPGRYLPAKGSVLSRRNWSSETQL